MCRSVGPKKKRFMKEAELKVCYKFISYFV